MSGLVVRGRLAVRQPRSSRPAKVRIDTPPARGRRAGTAERLARRLALAHWIERKIEAGELEDYAHAARVLGVTRARVSQVVQHALLPLGLQAALLEASICRCQGADLGTITV